MPQVTPSVGSRRALLGLLGASLLGACSSAPSAVSSTRASAARAAGSPHEPSDARDRAGELSAGLAREATFVALGLVGTPYRYGGDSPEGGFDCSGLIVYAFRTAASRHLPRQVAQLARVGRRVPATAARAGDLVFFDTSGRFSHAGIYVGDGRFVHAPSTGGRVRVEPISTRYWRPRLAALRRV